jgi:hypothetical protein
MIYTVDRYDDNIDDDVDDGCDYVNDDDNYGYDDNRDDDVDDDDENRKDRGFWKYLSSSSSSIILPIFTFYHSSKNQQYLYFLL